MRDFPVARQRQRGVFQRVATVARECGRPVGEHAAAIVPFHIDSDGKGGDSDFMVKRQSRIVPENPTWTTCEVSQYGQPQRKKPSTLASSWTVLRPRVLRAYPIRKS